MRARRILHLALPAAAALLLTWGCTKDDKGDSVSKDEMGKLSVTELASALGTNACTAIDANSARVRSDHGVIPGAVLLSHYRKYDASELPEDKQRKLVFYCTNHQCGASHAAAEKAVLAGYTDVHVLPAGVMGWKEAGQPTQTVQ